MFKGARPWLAGCVVLLLAGMGAGTLRAIDNTGWLPHERDTDMYFGAGDWPVGTYRDCAALPVKDGTILFMGCVAGPENYLSPQSVQVTYWGRIKRPDRFQAAMSISLSAWKWRCLRKDNAVTCWAVN